MLKNSKLYLILDKEVASYDRLFEVTKQAVAGGVDLIQLRDKNGTSEDIIKFSRKITLFLKRRIPFIINDRVDLALACGADGVHLGQDDLPIALARRLMGKNAIIGVSCQTLQHAKFAFNCGADYIGFGSVFKTLTKPKRQPMNLRLLADVVSGIKIPVFAIGGINAHNILRLKGLGVDRVAVCRDICLAKDVRKTTDRFKALLSSCPCCCAVTGS